MELSTRLKTVAGAVTPGHIPADIGTDHGYVPVYLVKHGICPRALAMDINPGPLARARDNIHKEGLGDRIITRLSDGLENLRADEADTVIIAGMGGALICRILDDAPDLLREGKELILSPHSEWFKVRRFLSEHDYRIRQEWFLKEDGKYYVVIKAWPRKKEISSTERNGCGHEESFAEAPAEISASTHAKATSPLLFEEDICDRYGRYLLEEGNPVLYEYLKEDVEKKRKILSELAARGKEGSPRYKELESLAASAEEAISIMDRHKTAEPDDKPGYVANDHLSDPAVAGRL